MQPTAKRVQNPAGLFLVKKCRPVQIKSTRPEPPAGLVDAILTELMTVAVVNLLPMAEDLARKAMTTTSGNVA